MPSWGSGTYTFGFQANASVSNRATLNRVNDKFHLSGNRNANSTTSAKQTAQSSGTSSHTSGDVVTDTSFSARQGADASAKNSLSASYVQTERGRKVSGTTSASVSAHASTASQAVGTITDTSTTETSLMRTNEAGSYIVVVASSGSKKGTFYFSRPRPFSRLGARGLHAPKGHRNGKGDILLFGGKCL